MKALKWFYMLNKRLYKKAVFIAIMALILVATVVFAFSSEGESGVLRVVLAQSNKEDKISASIISGLKDDNDTVITFIVADSPDEAVKLVKNGNADAAWIFPEDMGEGSDYEAMSKKGAIRVVERETNVLCRLSRERLNSEVFEHTARAFFIYYSEKNLPQSNFLTEEEKLYYFENTPLDDTLFIFDNPVSTSKSGSSDYLTAPLRGLLAVIVLLGGMAAVLYYMKDEEKRLYANIPLKRKPLVALAAVSAATLNISVASMIALGASGLYKINLSELLAVPLYALVAASFCLVLYRIFGSLKLYGAIIPAVIVVVSCVSPVFFYAREAKVMSFLFPPTYFVNVSVNAYNLIYMVIYSAVCLGIFYLLGLKKRA